MEAGTGGVNQMSCIVPRLFPAVGPMLLISMGYIDPGKWSAVVEGGARFGFDLLLLLLVFNCAAILCQYLAARIGVVTGKNLAQICSEEYNESACIILGVQAEVSMIVLDLTMILGIAHGLNLLFGVNLFTCLLFTATDAVLFPFFSTLLEKCKAEIFFVGTAGFVLLCYVLGVLISQPEIPFNMNGMLTKLSGESVFTLMSLLGANIMPHNFYVHSAIVQQQQQQQQGPLNVSNNALWNDQFFAILSIFSGIYLVNYVVMNSAATIFHSTGLVVLNLQDMLLLMDQLFRSPIALFGLFLVLFISSHVTALTWNLGGQVVLRDLLKMDPPVWLHRATIRIFAIVLALYCTWNSGAEGIYQLLVFTQVVLAMLLPSSVVPLFRVASSRSVMGIFKISPFVEFLALITLIGMVGLNIIFVVEMFGNSDWVGNLRWNDGGSTTLSYVFLLITACASLVLMLWLAATPLKSATTIPEAPILNWDLQRPEVYAEDQENDDSYIKYPGEDSVAKEPALENFECHSDDSVVESESHLPETIMDSDREPHLPVIEENLTIGPSFPPCHSEDSASTVELVPVAVLDKEVSDAGLLDVGTLQKIESVEGESQIEKDDEDGDTSEPKESSRGASVSESTLTSEGPGSFKSFSVKSDEGGNGNGSLSRLSGLGRTGRRQLASILDEFWGQLYDFHGLPTQEGKAKKLNVLFGLDPKPAVSSLKMDPAGSFLINPSMQQRMSNSVESSYGFQTGSSSSWSTQMQNSSRGALDSGERRYSSLRLPQSSEGRDYQPATIHGYQLTSYLSRTATDRNLDSLNTLLDSPTPKSPSSPSFVPASYKDPLTYTLGQTPQNRVSTARALSMHNPVISRNSRLQAERPYYDPCSSGPSENIGSSEFTKKYHSLPDISGRAVPRWDSCLANSSPQWNGPPGFGPSVGRMTYEQPLNSNTGSRTVVPLAFDELSPSKLYRGAFSTPLSINPDPKSLWSRQPSEQLFGVAGKTHVVGNGVGRKPSLVLPESISHVDSEFELLQSFRLCVMKLLKLEGCDWLFRQNGEADEDLIDRVAARERFYYEAETRETNQVVHTSDSQYLFSDKKFGSVLKNQEAGHAKFLVSSIPHCGESCIWRADLIVSFGVWCIHRVLELALMESRPELWGKYTFVLNRLQGILDPAFSKLRSPLPTCFCLQIPASHAKRSGPLQPNGQLPAKQSSGKCTSAGMLLEIIKEVEASVSCRKGRTGTAAGDVAFPKGKENLASVLKRYKRRLSNKPVGIHDGGLGSGSRKAPVPTSYAL